MVATRHRRWRRTGLVTLGTAQHLHSIFAWIFSVPSASSKCSYRPAIFRFFHRESMKNLFTGIRKRVFRCASLFITIFSLLPLAVDARESAVMELVPPKAVRGQVVIIKIRTTIPWNDKVIISHPQLSGSMTWWAYPYARPWGMSHEDGTITRMVEVRASIRVDAPGFHSIDPFRIQAGDYEAVTEIARIIGVEKDEQDLPYPVFMRWRSLPETVWQGQTITLILEVQNFPFLTLADSVKLNKVPTGLLEDAPGFGQIITRPYSKTILYDVPMASWLWTLSEPGNFQFPDVRVNVNGLVRDIRGFTVNVKDLPLQARQYGAVGRFLLDTEWEDKQYRVGEIVSIRVSVEGEGNLSVLRTPVPEVSGTELVSTGSSTSYVPGPLGYHGWREERFDYRFNKGGMLKIHIPQWTWLNPHDSNRLYNVGEQSYMIQVDEASDEEVFNVADILLGSEIFRYRAVIFHGKILAWYLLALPGFLMLATLYLRRGIRPGIISAVLVFPLLLSAVNIEITDVERVSKAKEYALNGDWEQAAVIYDSLSETYGELPGLLHDRAVIAMETGLPIRAVSLMRRGLYLRPGDKVFSKSLEFIENRLGLSDQVGVPLIWPPAMIFAIWLIGVNGLFFSLAGLLYKRGARDYSVLAAVLIFLIISTVTLVYTNVLWNKQIGIVNTDSQTLRKIPGPLASEWIKLPAGSAVEVMAVGNGDCLVRTGYGLEGWIPLTSIFLVTEDTHGL